MAAEILLMDKVVTAEEALKAGFVNQIIPELQKEPEFFDLAKVPAIGKLLATDYRTLTNCKSLMNQAKDFKSHHAALEREGTGLLNTWLDPGFPEKLQKYLMQIAKEKAARQQRAKL